MKKKIFTLLLAVAASVGTMFAWDYERVQIGDLYYNLDATNQTAEVTSQESSYPYWSTSITTANIPASVEYNSVTYSVTSIGWHAFSDCSSLTSVTIGNSVANIGYCAFYECGSLTSIEIPNSVTSIGTAAFYNCQSLTSLELPESVSHIGEEGAFCNCGITSPVYNSHLFAYCPPSIVGAYIIPNGITTIASQAFGYCVNLTSVTCPSTLSSIESFAFYSCNQLTSIEIPSSVSTIGYGAFSGCGSLASIYNYAETPQVVAQEGNGGIFGYDEEASCVNKFTCKLYVPEKSIPLYRVATEWRDFAYIEAIETSQDVENIVSEKQQGVKEIRHGQVLIKKNDKTYTLTGQEVK